MPRTLNTPDRLFDRTWRAGHPFRPRLSRWRRFGMIALLLFLLTIIAGYSFVTNSRRVKALAESSLSGLLGGRVEVGKATLSIFQGLKLEEVHIYVGDPETGKDDEGALFSAARLEVLINPGSLLAGKLEMREIKVIDPRVRLTENIETGKWSFQRLKPHAPRNDTPAKPNGRPPVLPKITLRNAKVEYTQAGESSSPRVNAIMLEGQFTPMLEPDTYNFSLQSRGESEGVGPSVSGTLVMGTNQVKAKLSNLVIGPDFKAMLPVEVKKSVEDHQMAGAVDAEVNYQPNNPDHRFFVQMDLGGVSLTVRPEEWMGSDEVRRLAYYNHALDVLKLAGLNSAPPRQIAVPLVDAPFIDHLKKLENPSPLRVDSVAGRFVFTQDGIDIENGHGRVETNGFNMSGHIGGYKPSAAAHMHISSSETENLFIPAAPRYVSSMPPPVREVYDRFKPQGEASFWVDIDRPTGGDPDVQGELSILNGQFSYEKFTYPVHNVTGVIAVGKNENGEPCIGLRRIRGKGIEGGPNANADFEINGWMAPLGPSVEIHVDVTGRGITNEPALLAAFPSGAQKAIALFDPTGTGEFPKYRGDFGVNVVRDYGRKSHWHVGTTIHLADASGSLTGFPYPLSGVSGDLKIGGDRVDITNVNMKRGDSTLAIDGSVSWGASTTQPAEPFVKSNAPATQQDDFAHIRPDLHIVAKNVPIDADLIHALPEDRRPWLEKLGVGGVIDVDGYVKPPEADAKSDLNLDLAVDWRKGTLSPNNTLAASDMSGSMRLTPAKIVLKDITGKRGDADIAARGTIAWPDDALQIALFAEAKNLTLDKPLYALLPDAAKKGWDAVHPEGTVDATVRYSGGVASTTAPTTAPSDTGYAVILTPRKLAVTPEALPYKLTDVTGQVTVQPDQVTLKDITAKHGGASIQLAGTGGLAANGVWDLRLAAADMLVDDDLRKAVPAALASLLQSLNMQGKVAFNFSKLRVTVPTPATQPAVAKASDPPPDVDFALKLKATDAAMDVGVPLSHFGGMADLTGSTRNGKLYQLTGSVAAQSAQMADRPLTDLHLNLNKPAGYDLLEVKDVQGKIADGDIAGQMEWAYPDNGPSRYAVGLVLRGADVRTLTGEQNSDLHGRLAASLAVEGTYNDPASRRGRGDVSVTGSDMYHIPLVLGLLQITNLALPITSPFNEATARYSIDGQRVVFEQIELRAKEMVMQGNGQLEFDTKKVHMTFTTDNTTWPSLPVIGDILKGARHELLQIHVNGTLKEPKVSATAMNTFTTTVDQVFKGDDSGQTTTNGKKNKGY